MLMIKKQKVLMEDLKREVERMQRTGVPRCQKCHKDFKKIKEESSKYHSVWKPDCECFKNKNLRLSLG